MDFYCRALGLELLSRTINLDEPSTLQLYCADAAGTPGTIISLLEYPHIARAHSGSGAIGSVVFHISPGSTNGWREKLTELGIKIDGAGWNFGKEYICLQDPDGLALALVEEHASEAVPASRTSDPLKLAVGRIASVELNLQNFEYTATLLTDVLGFAEEGRDRQIVRFSTNVSSNRFRIDVLSVPLRRKVERGTGSAGSVILQVKDPEALEVLRQRLVAAGYDTTLAIDRAYFTAIYFEGPEGICFGAATPKPGFPQPTGGPDRQTLDLPQWLEGSRGQIESRLQRARERAPNR